MRRRALLSVTEKEGVIDLARALTQSNFEIVATSGTHRALVAAGISALEVSDVTSVGELAGGRVKTLHPAIFAGILATGKEREKLESEGIAPIDIVVVNLYRLDSDLTASVESIDIGGVALIRSAAKNHHDVTLVSSPSQYQELIDALPLGLDEKKRQEWMK